MGEIVFPLLHNAFSSGWDCPTISNMLTLAAFSSVSVILAPPFCCLYLSAVQLLSLGTGDLVSF